MSRSGPASCALLYAEQLPGGARQHRPSATRSGTCERTNARPKGTAHVHRAIAVSRERGLGANNRRVERREASVLRHWTRGVVESQRTQGRRYRACGPTSLAREGCLASTRAPVGAPLPCICAREKLAKLGGRMTRENDETRAVRSPHGATRLRSLCELRRASVRRSAHAEGGSGMREGYAPQRDRPGFRFASSGLRRRRASE